MKQITCKERDRLLADHSDWKVYSSLTDMYGSTTGSPRIETVWHRGTWRLEDMRFPDPYNTLGEDAEPCVHYFWEEEDEDEDI